MGSKISHDFLGRRISHIAGKFVRYGVDGRVSHIEGKPVRYGVDGRVFLIGGVPARIYGNLRRIIEHENAKE